MAIAAALLGTSPVAFARKAPLVGDSYGPPPDWDRYRELGEAAVTAILIDPESARIRWPHGYIQRGYTPLLRKRVYGYATCGRVNARNRMGGYTGEANFVVVIDNDQVLYVEIDSSSGLSLLAEACLKGGFPPPPPRGNTTTSSDPVLRPAPPASFSVLGLKLLASPDSVRIDEVAPGGSGQRAAVMPGMTITKINGIVVKGLSGMTVEQLLTNLDGPARLEMSDGKIFTVSQP